MNRFRVARVEGFMISLPGRLRRPALVVAVVGLTAAVLLAGPSSADVQQTVHAAGWYAPLAFVALYPRSVSSVRL